MLDINLLFIVGRHLIRCYFIKILFAAIESHQRYEARQKQDFFEHKYLTQKAVELI